MRSDDSQSERRRGPKPQAKAERLAREAAALRANLHKRKAQARAQEKSAAETKGD